jgi:hypothetical protein
MVLGEGKSGSRYFLRPLHPGMLQMLARKSAEQLRVFSICHTISCAAGEQVIVQICISPLTQCRKGTPRTTGCLSDFVSEVVCLF